MYQHANLQILLLAGMLGFCYLVSRLVRYNKGRKINTELWCTVFEGLTQGAVRLDHLKAPETVIEVKIRRDGKERDSWLINTYPGRDSSDQD